MQTEKSRPVHTSNPSSAAYRSSPCGVPSADERRLSLPHRAAYPSSPRGLARPYFFKLLTISRSISYCSIEPDYPIL